MDYTRLEDVALLRLVTGQNESALSALYDRYSRLVFGMAIKVVGEETLAEEITQDVFVSVWQKAHTYQPERARVITWIASIARHRAIDVLRYQRAHPASPGSAWEADPLELETDPADVEAEVELTQERRRVLRGLAALPQDQRRALALAYFQGLSHSEIAAELGEPLGTVKTRIRLAMGKLRLILAESEARDA